MVQGYVRRHLARGMAQVMAWLAVALMLVATQVAAEALQPDPA